MTGCLWVAAGLAGWTAAAFAAATVIGRAIALADRRRPR